MIIRAQYLDVNWNKTFPLSRSDSLRCPLSLFLPSLTPCVLSRYVNPHAIVNNLQIQSIALITTVFLFFVLNL
eukprot:1298459-Amorphochlora_amoeboformis.AAC.1